MRRSADAGVSVAVLAVICLEKRNQPHGLVAQKVIAPGCPISGYDTGES
jgi:hypothetical protein